MDGRGARLVINEGNSIYERTRKLRITQSKTFEKPEAPGIIHAFVIDHDQLFAVPCVATFKNPRMVAVATITVSSELVKYLKDDSKKYYALNHLLNAYNYLGSTFIFQDMRYAKDKVIHGLFSVGNFGSVLLDYISAIEISTIYNKDLKFTRTETRILYRLIQRARGKGIKYDAIFLGLYEYCFNRSTLLDKARERLCNALHLDYHIIQKFEDALSMNDMRSTEKIIDTECP